MRRSDWTERLKDWGIGYAAGALVVMLFVALLDGCALREMSKAPSGKPGCVAPQRWSDSAQKCLPKATP